MAHTFNTSLKNIAMHYCKLLQVNVTRSSVERDIEENPYYPSLLSLSDTFSQYNIFNNAYKVSTEDLSHVAPPYVAFIRTPKNGNDFVLVKNVDAKNVSYFYDSSKLITVDKTVFFQNYQNIIWIAQPDDGSGESNFLEKREKEKNQRKKKIAWALSAATILLIVISINIPTARLLSFSVFAIFKLIGIATAISLLIYETDKSNAFTKNLCSAIGKNDCEAVLTSNAAKVLRISWSEIGFFYFTATLCWLLLPVVNYESKVIWLAIANACTIPYIFFSIYYQWRVVKQWCLLCLTIQLVLLFELTLSTVEYWKNPVSPILHPSILLAILFCLLLPIVFWYGLKQVFIKAKDHHTYYTAYKRLQYNPEIFNSLLQQQTKAPDGWQQLGITLGNPNAKTTIIKICNPFCNPCAKAHPQLEEIIKNNDDVQLRIIFTTTNNKLDKGSKVVQHLLAIAAKGNTLQTTEALDSWYLADKKNYETFAAKFLINGELKEQEGKIDAMSKWCTQAEITHTPTLFINGHRIPENYSIEELKYIL